MFDISLAGAFLAGLLSFFSPCVLPLVPPYLCYIGGVSYADLARQSEPAGSSRAIDWRIGRLALVFTLGFATVFVALGATVSTLGMAITSHYRTLSMIAGALIFAMGLHMAGFIRIPLLYREARFQAATTPASAVGAYLMGLAFAFGWTPCVGPVLASILIVAGAEASAIRGASLLAAYALGIGIPFIIAGLFAPGFIGLLARIKGGMGLVERIMGAGLMLTGLLFMTGAMPRIAGWLLETFPALATIG
ncbi:MAG: cytochrome c biogenesis CcdA family protein [Bosea sp. (in: a-proteobacteria)]